MTLWAGAIERAGAQRLHGRSRALLSRRGSDLDANDAPVVHLRPRDVPSCDSGNCGKVHREVRDACREANPTTNTGKIQSCRRKVRRARALHHCCARRHACRDQPACDVSICVRVLRVCVARRSAPGLHTRHICHRSSLILIAPSAPTRTHRPTACAAASARTRRPKARPHAPRVRRARNRSTRRDRGRHSAFHVLRCQSRNVAIHQRSWRSRWSSLRRSLWRTPQRSRRRSRRRSRQRSRQRNRPRNRPRNRRRNRQRSRPRSRRRTRQQSRPRSRRRAKLQRHQQRHQSRHRLKHRAT